MADNKARTGSGVPGARPRDGGSRGRDGPGADIVEIRERLARLEGSMQNVATKADLAELRSEIKADKAELKADIADLRSEMKTNMADLRLEIKADKTELKADIADLRSKMKADVTGIRLDMEKDKAKLETVMAETKVSIIIWLVGTMISGTSAMLVIARFFPGAS